MIFLRSGSCQTVFSDIYASAFSAGMFIIIFLLFLYYKKKNLSVNKIRLPKNVQRVLKVSDFGWKRIRPVPKGKPDPEEYEEKKKQLKIIREQEEKGEAEVWYYDESGFCLAEKRKTADCGIC